MAGRRHEGVDVRFHVLGPVEVLTDDGRALRLPRRQERLVLAVLLLEAGRSVPVDRLCDLLWQDDPPQGPRQVIHSQISRIRSMLARAGAGEHGVELTAHDGGYVLKVDPDLVDAHQFRRLFREASHTAEPQVRERLLRDALARWRGRALDGAADEALRQRLCADLEEQRLQAVEASVAAGLELGRHREVLPELARYAAEGRTVRERLVELHMLALYHDGRTADALDVFQHARKRLADELGLDPGEALQRVHQAILRGDPLPRAVPAVVGRPITPALLPPDLNTFAGRAEPLEQLDGLLAGNANAVVISAIGGTAGIGKTTLAVHWAHRVRERFPDGQLYVNLRGFDPAGSPTTAGDVVRRFLDALGVPGQTVPASLDAQIDRYRSVLAGKRVLIVLDNARNAGQVRPLLPGAPGCVVLVTSRDRLTGLVAIDGAHALQLDLPTSQEAWHLLTARLGEHRLAAEPDAANEIITQCARLPLALAIAAARAAMDPHLSLAALAAELRDNHRRLDALTGDDTATDIRAVFAYSYQTLSPQAARLFRLLGLHPGPDCSTTAAASLAGIPPGQVKPLLAELTRAHLTTEPAPGRYAFHDLLRAYASELLPAGDPDRPAALDRLYEHYVHTAHAADRLLNPHRDDIIPLPARAGVTTQAPADRREAMSWFTVERQVLLHAIRQATAAGLDGHAWQLAFSLTSFLDLQGHWSDLATAQHAAIVAAQRLHDRSGEAQARRMLARAQMALGRHRDSDAELGLALRLFEEAGDLAGHGHTHVDLARARGQRGAYREALDHALRALDLYRKADHRVGQANVLNNIGWYHAHLGEYAQARTRCQEALTLFRQLADPLGQAAAWDSLGYVDEQLGRHGDAVAAYRHAVDLCRKLGDRFYEADTLSRLGDTHRAAGDHDAARTAWQEALAIFEELDHHDAELVRSKLV